MLLGSHCAGDAVLCCAALSIQVGGLHAASCMRCCAVDLSDCCIWSSCFELYYAP